jgi:hypothetical protein
LKARTGLSTPPGSSCCAREKSRSDRVVFMETTLCRKSPDGQDGQDGRDRQEGQEGQERQEA